MPVAIQILIALLAGGALGIFLGWLKWGGKGSDARLGKRIARADQAARIGTDAASFAID